MTMPVSGPGPFSQRTDKQPMMDLPDAGYGEQASFQALQQGAPLAADSGQPPAGAAASAGPDLSGLVGLGADSQRPDESIMTGVGSPGIDMAGQDIVNRQAWLPVLTFMGDQPGASWALRQAVRKLQAGPNAVTP